MAATLTPNKTHRRSKPRQPTLPFAALAEHLGVSETEAGRMLTINGSRLAHLRAHGVAIDVADRYACRLGVHPAEVWPNWYRVAG
ncbi:MAG TPA: hypothetical protein VHD87_15640 [Acidimicrobiales bacterium]|nr:hypothetical protein [Acidimicrobiales bacterium]